MTDVVKMFTDIFNPQPKKVSDNEDLINQAIAELTARLNANAANANAVPPTPAAAAANQTTTTGGVTLELLLNSPVIANAVKVIGDNPDLLKLVIQAWMAKQQQQAPAPAAPATPPATTGGSGKP